MNKLSIAIFAISLIILFLIGCTYSPTEADAEYYEITQSEKEQQILNSIQRDYFVDSVTFNEDTKTFVVVSDYHVRAFEIAKRGEGLELRSGDVISWEDYINHYINSYFNGRGSEARHSFDIINILGKGYTVKEVTSEGEIVFIAKDGELIYDIITEYVN